MISESVATGVRGATERGMRAPGAARCRLLFITLAFPPSREIGAHACEQIGRYFPLYGWDPIVLTGPKRLIESADPSHRRAFPGKIVEAGLLPHPILVYRKLKRALARSAGNDCRLVGKPNEHAQGRFRRWILSLFQTPDIYTGWFVPATMVGLRAIRRERITHIFSSGPCWTNHLVGLALAWLTGLTWTIHFRDPWNEMPQAKDVSAFSANIEKMLQRVVIKRADSVVCVTEAHTRLLRQIFADLPVEKFVTIPNGYDESEWDSIQLEKSDRNRFIITYTGSFMMGTRSPRPVFRALRTLIDAGHLDLNKVRVDLIGHCDVAEGIGVTDMAAEYGLSGFVQVSPPVSRPEILRRMANSNLLLLLAEGWTLQIPGKTYEYLRAGRPILALTAEGALTDLLRQTGGGWTVQPEDHGAIMRVIHGVYNDWRMGRATPPAHRALIGEFDRRRLAGRFAGLFDQASAGRHATEWVVSSTSNANS